MPVRLLLVATLALSLTGCSLFEGEGSLENRVKEIQGYTVELCKYLPTAQSVTAIVTASNPAVSGGFAVAQAICVAVTRQASKATLYKDSCPKVNGVCVEGDYIEK
jgi:hypothetical protein